MQAPSEQMPNTADLILIDAKLTTLTNDGTHDARALAVSGERFVAVGNESEVLRLRDKDTRVISAQGRRVVPGLNDSHLHAVRGALLYNLELRWDGVPSLKRAIAMIGAQAKRTPADQWVRVMGGWSPFQFAERRMPTIAELNQAAPHTPVLILFAYSEVLINKAGVERLGLTPDGDVARDGGYEFVDGGTIVTGNVAVYAVIAKLPALTRFEDRVNSTQNFLRELNRFGLTSTVDAGESATAYPDDYRALRLLATKSRLPVRISNFLFAQTSGTERAFWEKWTTEGTPRGQPGRLPPRRLCAPRWRRSDGLESARL